MIVLKGGNSRSAEYEVFDGLDLLNSALTQFRRETCIHLCSWRADKRQIRAPNCMPCKLNADTHFFFGDFLKFCHRFCGTKFSLCSEAVLSGAEYCSKSAVSGA